jgi:molybdopterin synthase catalytic subunit
MTAPLLAVTTAPLDLSALVTTVLTEIDRRSGQADRPGAGAVTTFIGTVRNRNQGRTVDRLEYEAYEPLALRAFARIGEEAASDWPDIVLGLHHRVGTLGIGEASVIIAAASPHRAEAFAACRYAIERIKQIAPIWKREYFAGGECWVEGAVADPDDRAAREEARRRACA